MHTILFADRSQHGIRALQPQSCSALMPVAGKYVIEYSLEELADAGLRDVTVVIGPEAGKLRAFLDKGERWGLTLRFVYSRGDEDPDLLIGRIGKSLAAGFLALRGDEIRSRGIVSFLSELRRRGDYPLTGVDSDGHCSMIFSPYQRCRLSALQRPLRAGAATRQEAYTISELQLLQLDTPQQVLIANTAITKGSLPGVLQAGLEVSPGCRSGRLSDISEEQLDHASTYIGDYARVHPSVLIRGNVVVGANSYIDKGTTLENCVVLPGTYVGAGLELRDCVIGARGLLKTTSEKLIQLPDPMWLGEVRSSQTHTPIPERILALMLFIVSLPLWPLLILHQAIAHLQLPLRVKQLRSNHSGQAGVEQTFTTLRWHKNSEVLNTLPGLLDVARGHLRFLGVPTAPGLAFARDTGHHPTDSDLTLGIISPARWYLPKNSPDEEIWLAELLYARSSTSTRLRYLLSGLSPTDKKRAVPALRY